LSIEFDVKFIFGFNFKIIPEFEVELVPKFEAEEDMEVAGFRM
jgi:hypothetical protein